MRLHIGDARSTTFALRHRDRQFTLVVHPQVKFYHLISFHGSGSFGTSRRVRVARCNIVWLTAAGSEVTNGEFGGSKLAGRVIADVVVALRFYFLHTHRLKSLLGRGLDVSDDDVTSCSMIPLSLPQVHDTAQPLLLDRGGAPRDFVDVPSIITVLLQLAHVALSEIVVDSVVLWDFVVHLSCKTVIPLWLVRSFVLRSCLRAHVASYPFPAERVPRRQAIVVVIIHVIVYLVTLDRRLHSVRHDLRLGPDIL